MQTLYAEYCLKENKHLGDKQAAHLYRMSCLTIRIVKYKTLILCMG